MTPIPSMKRAVYLIYLYLLVLVSPMAAEMLVSEATLLLLIQLIASFVILLFPLYVLAIPVRWYIVLSLPFLLVSGMQLTHYYDYGEMMTMGSWVATFETDINEAIEYLLFSKSAQVSALITFSIMGFVYWSSKGQKIGVPSKRMRWVFAFIMLFITIDFVREGPSQDTYPYRFVRHAKHYWQLQIQNQKIIAQRQGFSFEAKRVEPVPIQKEIYVMVIGESLRRGQLSLYGYPRDTTPTLDTLTNKIVFSDIISPATQSVPSLKAVLSLASVPNYTDFYTKKSIVSLFREVGFSTYWLSNQGRFGPNDSDITTVAYESDHVMFTHREAFWRHLRTSPLDEELLPLLDEVLAIEEPKLPKIKRQSLNPPTQKG